MKKGDVPDSFPGTLAIIDDKENNTLLHPGYRRYDKADDENFNYFVTRLLPTVTATKTAGYKAQKNHCLVSEIFTVTDEAFVLFVLYNEGFNWLEQMGSKAKGKKGKDLVREKRFCSGKSGKKNSWSERGLNCFYKLVGEVHKRREETKKMEEEMRARMAADVKDASPTSTIDQNKERNGTDIEWRIAEIEERLRIEEMILYSL